MANNTKNAASSVQRFSTIANDPLRNFRFIAVFEDTSDGTSGSYMNFTGGFSSITGLSTQTQSIQYREGGMNTSLHQVPGQTSFQPITMMRGVLHGRDEAINWMKQLYAAAAGEGIPGSKNFRCNISIYVLDHPIVGDPLMSSQDVLSNKAWKMKFKVHNAWITGLNFSDLSATDNGILYETISLVHEGLSVDFVN